MNNEQPKKGVREHLTEDEILARLSSIESQLLELDERLIGVEETKENLAEFIFQAVSMISGIFAMVLALLFGLSTQWNFSNHGQTAVIFFLGFIVVLLTIWFALWYRKWWYSKNNKKGKMIKKQDFP